MRNSRLSVEYSTAIYDSGSNLLPESPLNQIYAMEGIFTHVGAVGRLLQIIDEEKLEKMDSTECSLMLEGLGSLCTSLGNAGFGALLQQEWSSLFDDEEQAEAEPTPTEETNLAAKAVTA